MDENRIREIYGRMGDGISRALFTDRLLYSLTGDRRYMRQMLGRLPEAADFYRMVEERIYTNRGVIFGAGSWGMELKRMMEKYPFKYFIDNKPSSDRFVGLPVISCTDFLDSYQGETVVISSRLYHMEMHRQLLESGIAPEKIIDAGGILDEWSKRQYFDLEALKAEKEEIFVDAGSFDGMSSIRFSEWCMESEKRFVYAFEPDKKNKEKCHKNLSYHGIAHKIIPKGCWDEETELCFQAQGNGNSAVDPSGGEKVEVTAIDKELGGEKVTFIKMDIEGSELKALYGARDTIIKNRPKLAICVYHKPEDIWEIPSVILQYYQGYRFYIRHYSLADSETVLYALP